MVSRLTSRCLALCLGLIIAAPFGAFADRFPLFGSAEGILKSCLNGPTCWQTQSATGADVIDLWTGTCDSGTFLRGDGTCAAAGGGGGGVTSVDAAGTGVFAFTGGPITTTGTLTLTQTGTSGGVPYFSNGTTLSSSAALTVDRLILGGGAGGAPTVLGAGTSTQVLHGNAAGAPTWAAVALGSDVSGTLPVANGGTGNTALGALTRTDDTNVTLTLGGSPSTALVNAASITAGWTGQLAVARGGTGNASLGALTRTDDANVTLTLGGSPSTALVNAASITAGWTGQLAVARGGSGAATLTGLLQGNGSGAFTGIADSSTVGQVLRATGASAYGWGAVDLADTDAVTGLLPDANLSANVPLLNAASNVFSGIQSAPVFTVVTGGTPSNQAVWGNAASSIAIRTSGTNNFIVTSAGNTSTPALTAPAFVVNNTSVPANGIYRPGTNRLGFASATTYRGEFDASGNFLVSGGNYMLTSTTPRFVFNESDATTDEKIWHEQIDTKVWTFGTRTDADGAGRNALAVTRGTGVAITDIAIGDATGNPSFTLNGNGTLSGTGTFSAGRFALNTSGTTSGPTLGMFRPGTNRLAFTTAAATRGEFDANGQFILSTVGRGVSVAEGSNAKQGVATLVGGTVVVSNTSVTATSRIFLTAQSLGTVVLPSACAVSARTAATSFTILCDQPTDTSVMAYEIFEPSP